MRAVDELKKRKEKKVGGGRGGGGRIDWSAYNPADSLPLQS